MFSTPILDVAIGLCFFYLLLALICSTVNEMIAGWRKTRGKFLEEGIDRLLGGDQDLKDKFYNHPLIRGLARGDAEKRPSYIPTDTFATVMMDLVSGENHPLTDMEALRTGAAARAPGLKTTLTALMDSSKDAAALKDKIGHWFDATMDRVSGWYKRNAQRNIVLLACGITLVLNADTLKVMHVLWTNPSVRAAVVDEARLRAAKQPPDEGLPMVAYPDSSNATASTPVNVPASPLEALSDNEQKLLGQLTGWTPEFNRLGAAQGAGAWLGALFGIIYDRGIGWLLTALAVSLGAPFWFDLLNRFINIRNAGRSPDEPKSKTTAAAKPAEAKEG